LQKRLGKPPCPCTSGCITYFARVCLLGLGCEWGMGSDITTATRAAIACVVEIMKAEHEHRTNKHQSGQHAKVNGRQCQLLSWRNKNAGLLCYDGSADVSGESSHMESFGVSKGIADCTYVRTLTVASLFASATCSGTNGGFLRPRKKLKQQSRWASFKMGKSSLSRKRYGSGR
jgi:hypothetical protein